MNCEAIFASHGFSDESFLIESPALSIYVARFFEMLFFSMEGKLNRFWQEGWHFHDFRDEGFVDSVQALREIDEQLLFDSFKVNGLEAQFVEQLSPVIGKYFCDDNPYRLDYSFDGIRGTEFSVGTIVYVFNVTTDSIDIGGYAGKKLVLLPCEFVVLNLGLVSSCFELNTEDCLTVCIHSDLDGIEYFGTSSPFANQLPLPVRSSPPTLFNEPVNFERWAEQGFCVTSLNCKLADSLRDELVSETFQKVDPQLTGDKKYAARYISKHSLYKPREIREVYRSLLSSVRDELAPILCGKPNPHGDNVSLFSAPRGHYMEAHSDCADASPVIVIIYLRDELWVAGDGGEVDLSQVELVDSCVVKNDRVEPTRLIPQHGAVVILNNTSPKFQHRVEKVMSDSKRYSIILNFGMLTNPDWNVEFEERSGEYIEESITLSDPTDRK